MEKKQNLRTNQLLSAKVLTSDSRKSNQEPSGKQLPRNNLRRRDFTGNHNSNSSSSSNNNNNNGQNNNVQQHIFAPKCRGGGTEKRNNRPRTDGYPRSAGATASTSHTRLAEYDERRANGDEFEAELNSIYLPGSKKQNWNHLLNFNYAPRDRHDAGTLMHSGNNAKGHGYVKRIKYNKEQFLQANCQFVVNVSGDYAAHTQSPDLLVEWKCIEQIQMFGSAEEPQCPICLYHPVAAKMTRCGHVYCWPCILHYLALSDKKSWRKCPICYEAVHIGDLKSAVARPQRNYNCDDIVTLQLMCRSKDSLQVRKIGDVVSPTLNGNSSFPCLNDDAAATINSKLVLAKSFDIMLIIERERNELKCQLTSDGIDCPDSVFVQQALHLLEEREKLVSNAPTAQTIATDPLTEEGAEGLSKLSLNANAKEFLPSFDDAAAATSDDGHYVIDDETNLTVDDINIVPNNAHTVNSNNFYFYQSNDGQNLYLHSINVRMLQAMYGSLDAAPKTITGRIVQKEVCSMSEDLRRRLKYLQHLPVSCHFEVVEIQFDRLIVSAEILSKFKDELLMRQKTRERRAREEQKREKHIDRVNERQIGMIIRSTANIDVTSERQFPMCGLNFDDAPILVSDLSTSVDSSSSSVAPAAASAGPSFAKMLTSSQTGMQTELWPTLAQPKETTFSAADFLPLRPTRPQPVVQQTIVAHDHSDDESIDFGNEFSEEACAPPEFKSSFGSAIAEALNKSAHVKPTKNRSQVTNGRGKKKKNNGMVLFSTGGRTYDGN